MLGFIVAGSFGAALNCALASYFSHTIDHVLQDFFLTPLSFARSAVIPAVLGFFQGALLLVCCGYLKKRVVRALLSYNGWFLSPRRPANKLWYALVIALLGKKGRGSMAYQDHLPSLPLPTLENTCKRYLESLRPVLPPEQYSETELVVKDFLKKEGPKLQFFLRLRTWYLRNWIADWWIDYVYLRQRTPTVLNSNYFATGKPRPTSPHQLDTCAMQVHSSVMYSRLLRQKKLENPRANNVAPFCMNGHRYLHMTARIPGEEMDKTVCHEAENPRHAVIHWRGRFFKLDVLSEDGRVQTPLGIKQQLEKILQMAGDEHDMRGVSSFTALPRAEWAKIRKRLEESPVNRATLKAIDSCIQFVCLGEESPGLDDVTEQCRNLFHGNGNNRWFDKCIQLVVSKNSVIGANVEHSLIDATVAGQLWEYMLTDEEYDEDGRVIEPFRGQAAFEAPPPVELCWELEGMDEELERARKHLKDLLDDSDLVVINPGYGKRIIKMCKLSPDGWYQMTMQLAFYRMYNKFVQTYESATTRLFYKGRTETIRPISEASKRFCRAMCDPTASKDTIKAHLKEAIDYQCKFKLDAMRGLGIDRHLFGLYIVAKGMKMDPLPKIFQDKGFNLKWQLSTSQTPTKTTERWNLKDSSLIGGFGTVCEDGYGVSYIVTGEDTVHFSIHSRKHCPDTDSAKFGEHIYKAMADMRALFDV